MLMRVELVNTGTELLLGDTVNTNAAWIGQRLAALSGLTGAAEQRRQSGQLGLAAGAGVTAPYLSHLLIEHTGRSFVEWRNRIRLERFMTAWRPGANLLNTALEGGFGSYAQFHRVFSQLLGCSPAEWARRPSSQQATASAQMPLAAGIALADVGDIVHGTTLVTNAIIERKGAEPPT